MNISCERSQLVESTITLLELRGVKCQQKRSSGIIGGFKKLSNKYEEYAHVNENADVTPTEPSARAVISFQHGPSDNDGSRVCQHLSSLPLREECRDENNSIIMSSFWPADNRDKSSIQFSTPIKRVVIPDENNGKSVMSIPASVSLQIGVLIDGTDEVQPLGAATVLISGKNQSLELCIPVEANAKKQKYSPKTLFNKEMNPSKHTFGATTWTMLKIKLVVDAKQTDANTSIRSSTAASNLNNASPALVDKKTELKSRLRQLRINTRSQVSSLKTTTKSQVSLLKTTTRLQCTSLRSSLNSRKSRTSQTTHVAEPKLQSLPELTVLTPTSDVSACQCLDGATEIILNSSSQPSVASVPVLVKDDIAATDDNQISVAKMASVLDRSFDASSTCSIVTETRNQGSKVAKSDSKSVSTQDTRSSSDKSSSDGSFSDIIITFSRVTVEESEGDASTGVYPLPEEPPAQENPFSEDVTAQLDEIVKVYSMRVNAEEPIAVESVKDNSQEENAFTPQLEDSSVSSRDLLRAQTKPPVASLKTNATVAMNVNGKSSSQDSGLVAYSDDTQIRADVFVHSKDEGISFMNQPVLDMIQETPISDSGCSVASEDVQSVILIHADKNGAAYSVEVSVDGSQSKSNVQMKCDEQEAEPFSVNQHLKGERLSESFQISSATSVANPAKSHRDAYIILNHTMSSVGDLTVDTALDTATLPSVISNPSVISKPIRVARNKRHPQRKEAAAFLKRITVCGRKYDVDEMIDDAWIGWRDIVIGDEFDLCDGILEGSDDESDIHTLNTIESGVC